MLAGPAVERKKLGRMPIVIDYPTVLHQLTGDGLRCLYHNSGAFGFPADAAAHSRGWMGPLDSSIRESARPMVRQIPPPFETNLSNLFIIAWKETSPGPVWILPRSHWAYELQFGSQAWMPAALERIGIDPAMLTDFNNGSALEFAAGERELLRSFVCELLTRLVGSDFQAVFACRKTVCTIHSRGQLWWTTIDPVVLDRLDVLVPMERNDASGRNDPFRGGEHTAG